jgi:hypothetical protein
MKTQELKRANNTLVIGMRRVLGINEAMLTVLTHQTIYKFSNLG